jgi:hypothetical protein
MGQQLARSPSQSREALAATVVIQVASQPVTLGPRRGGSAIDWLLLLGFVMLVRAKYETRQTGDKRTRCA